MSLCMKEGALTGYTLSSCAITLCTLPTLLTLLTPLKSTTRAQLMITSCSLPCK